MRFGNSIIFSKSYGASLEYPVKYAAFHNRVDFVMELLIMGADPTHAMALLSTENRTQAYLGVYLERPNHLRLACEVLDVMAPVTLLQFVLEHPFPGWETRLPKLLADPTLRPLWKSKTVEWFRRGIEAAKEYSEDFGFTTAKEMADWYARGDEEAKDVDSAERHVYVPRALIDTYPEILVNSMRISMAFSRRGSVQEASPPAAPRHS